MTGYCGSNKEVDPLTQLGALSSQSQGAILFESVKGHPGWRVCDRFFGTRELRTTALHTTPERLLQEAAARIARGRGESRMVKEGPVQEVIITGEDLDLFSLPVAISSEGDGGQYISSGMGVTKDPDTGIQNEAYYRTQIKGRNRATCAMGPREGFGHLIKYEARGEPTPIAIVIGHHPAYEIATAYNGPHVGYEEFELAASLLEEPVEFLPCHTIDLRVPAHAEIVIEGLIAPQAREAEGPFGEYTGYMGPAGTAPVFEAQAITMRKDAIYRHLNGSRNTDQQALSTLLGEVSLYGNLLRAFGATQILDVHLPLWAMFTTIIQMVPQHEGQAKSVLMSTLGLYPLAKVVIVVDDDIDIHDPKDVMWALSCRVNPATDITTVTGTRGFKFDPSTPDLTREERLDAASLPINGVMGIDATKPPVRRPAERARYTRARPMGDGKVHLKDFL